MTVSKTGAISPDGEFVDLNEWLTYLEQLHPKSIDMGLERIDQVRTALGLIPCFPMIIVGGTNGKGSVCAMLESILAAAGYHVGCYTSPHLIRYNERIRIGQRAVAEEQLLKAFKAVEQARIETGVSLTYFEFGTLAAMHVFMAKQIDVAILEVGLGGRLDAVNIFDADCAILTSVDLDHQDYLGDSREAIGYEKAGIFRQNKPAVCADAVLPLSVQRHAQEIGAEIRMVHQDFGFMRETNQWRFWSQHHRRHALPMPALHGRKQLYNASACLMALELLREQLQVSMHAVREGLLNVKLPGRFQVISVQPMVVLDVLHNPAAAAAFADNLLEMAPSSGKTYAVFGMLHDKDIAGVVEELKPHIDNWLIATIDAPRGAHADELMQILNQSEITRENHTIHEFEDVVSAYVFACEHAGKNDRICVFGSFYTVGAILRHHGE
ncbi:dihydrofolate synthase / folylpolyglutamate synthase [Nitrosomonas marina]|uniref:Dihydrofolate synthase/folylpolyglutamate synthase n=1 Tax=Nitrosomonas marina TaxID=917 RepID=A0A1H9Z7G2_9PROT|nr:bifunctional tetrahydrofolate synthase/dihydrofolate synthase [Nitrosomonas marina]SES77470.1 dihydrofolate synthase / folylpolyglutamate synthase [Nitrosomonas marina]